MKIVAFSRAVSLLAMGIAILSGCGNEGGAESRSRPVVEGTAVEVEGLTTFSNPKSTYGELVYVPIYSSVFHRTADKEYLLTATLSIHNVDLTERVQISAVSYFDTEGGAVREFLAEPAVLAPLSTRQFVVPQSDRSGGPGANFLVKWESETEIATPMIEAPA